MTEGAADLLPGARDGVASSGPLSTLCCLQVTATNPMRTATIANPTSARPAVRLRPLDPRPFGVFMALLPGEVELPATGSPPTPGLQPTHSVSQHRFGGEHLRWANQANEDLAVGLAVGMVDDRVQPLCGVHCAPRSKSRAWESQR